MALALRLRKVKNKAHRMLELLLWGYTVATLLFILKFFFLYNISSYPILQYYNMLYALVTAPFIYFYFVALLRPGKLSWQMAARHSIPFAAWCLAIVALYLSGNAPQPYYHISEILKEVSLPANVVRFGIIVSFTALRLGYIVVILVMLRSYRLRIKTHFSYTEGINLIWAYWALLAVLLCSFLPIMVSAFQSIPPSLQLIYTSTSAICVSILFFAGYYQPTLYADEDKEGYAIAETKHSSLLSDDVRERLKGDLLKLFEEKKCFQSPTLSIDDVAKDLNTNRTYVSRIINEEFGSNFYAFVNGYRMKEFMSRLHENNDGESFKIKEESELVGFKSYSSFFSYFREEMGTTPSEYLRHRHKPDNPVKE